jgi:hypothetical protein
MRRSAIFQPGFRRPRRPKDEGSLSNSTQHTCHLCCHQRGKTLTDFSLLLCMPWVNGVRAYKSMLNALFVNYLLPHSLTSLIPVVAVIASKRFLPVASFLSCMSNSVSNVETVTFRVFPILAAVIAQVFSHVYAKARNSRRF